MFVIVDLRDKTSKHYLNCETDVQKVVSDITQTPYEGNRIANIIKAMRFGDVWQTNQYRIRFVSDGLVHKQIWLDKSHSCTDTVNKIKNCILFQLANDIDIEFISIGDEIDCVKQADGGNINDFLVWFKNAGMDIPLRIHSSDCEHAENIRNIIHRLKLNTDCSAHCNQWQLPWRKRL